jgi:hypothetical protein
MMLVTFGRHGGLSSLPFGQFSAAFFARIKSQDMLVGRVARDWPEGLLPKRGAPQWVSRQR